MTYLVMEHIQGETLADRLLKGRLPLDQALGVATEIADAFAVEGTTAAPWVCR